MACLEERKLSPELEKKAEVTVADDDMLAHQFSYYPATDETIPKFKAIREAGLQLARIINDNCPPGADRSAAIRQVRESVMTANAAIATFKPE